MKDEQLAKNLIKQYQQSNHGTLPIIILKHLLEEIQDNNPEARQQIKQFPTPDQYRK